MNTSYQLDSGELFIDFDLYDPECGGSGVDINSITACTIDITDLVSDKYKALIEEHCALHAENEYREAKYAHADAIYEARRDR
jgi:hypothetical protein